MSAQPVGAFLKVDRALGSTRERAALGRRILLLALLPALDAIINQINTAFQITIGSLSMLQAFRGTLLLVLVFMIACTPRPRRASRFAIGGAMLCLLICISVMAINQAVTGGGVELGDLITYVQMGYWITVWYAAQSWIRDASDARKVLNGLMAGALVTAASVCYGYIVGVDNSVYEAAGVKASSGFFVSGKGIAGALVVGGITAAYLGMARRTWRHPCAAVFCFGACFLTYARAGLVALCASLFWLLIWSTFFQARSGGSWARRVIAVSILGAAMLIAAIGVTDLTRRWSDLKDPNRAGSGRLEIWTFAAESFDEANFSQRLAGRGYQGMVNFINSKLGVEIHTHNDVLDMLVMGGMVGIGLLLLVVAALGAQILSTPAQSPEFAAAISILLTFFCQAILTGQLFMPDVMSYYVMGITALLVSTAPVMFSRVQFAQAPGFRPAL
ncbi:MAG: O-antigen ligase family protein [Acidobacteriaceae bacterium]|nr:O-antigen ligase family protein [Acidobacteriaceae bacterium]MBV9501248.1 O-antigen ligase family protein [Acidobacteriaceae bacterium]